MAKRATFKVAKQSAKGTAATTGFHCGLYTTTGLGENWELVPDTDEHGCTTASTVFRDLSAPTRTFYTVEGNAEGFLYPNVIGAMILGLGFADSVSGTTAKTHVMTAASATADPWLTILHDGNADVGSTLERRAKDCRTTKLKIDADNNGVKWSADVAGLSLDTSLGTETSTTEPTTRMLRSLGTFALTFDPAGTPVVISSNSSNAPRGLSLTIDNPTSKDDYPLWSSALGDLPRDSGIRIEGEFSGIPVQYSVYKQLMWGGASGTAPSATWKDCSADIKFTTAEEITTGVPYSLQFTLPRIRAWLDPDNYKRTGANDGRWTIKWQMYVGTSTPVTATLINSVATY